MFQNNDWNFTKLLWTALMIASSEGHTGIVRLINDKIESLAKVIDPNGIQPYHGPR